MYPASTFKTTFKGRKFKCRRFILYVLVVRYQIEWDFLKNLYKMNFSNNHNRRYYREYWVLLCVVTHVLDKIIQLVSACQTLKLWIQKLFTSVSCVWWSWRHDIILTKKLIFLFHICTSLFEFLHVRKSNNVELFMSRIQCKLGKSNFV